MQWNFGLSVATDKKKTAAHTFCTCPCWKWSYVANSPKAAKFQNSIFCPPRYRPCI